MKKRITSYQHYGQETLKEEIRKDNIKIDVGKIVVWKPEGKKSFANLGEDVRIILILILKK